MLKNFQHAKTAFEDKLVRIALKGFMLPTIAALVMLFYADVSVYFKLLLLILIFTTIFITLLSIRQTVTFQLRTSTNLVEAMTSGDYGMRANNKDVKGALADFNELLNTLASRLSEQSLITREKQILLSKITDQIDVAVVAVNDQRHITLMNPAAERLFKQRFEDRQGWPITSLGLQNLVAATQQENLNKVSELEIGDNKRKMYVRTDTFFELGIPHYLIFITDIQHILRDEERVAWQRLLRVLSHEINNSLTPIASIAETLHQLVKTQEDDPEVGSPQLSASMKEGLSVISERAHALNLFIQDYQQLTRVPSPTKSVFKLTPLVQQICQLFDSCHISIPEQDVSLYADRDQLQQVLINVFKNANEANISAGNTASPIHVNWVTSDTTLTIHVTDKGQGIHNTENLFVPFYTTKQHGSGIGLILCRQIILNHGGEFTLANAPQGGARASIQLPLIS